MVHLQVTQTGLVQTTLLRVGVVAAATPDNLHKTSFKQVMMTMKSQ